MSKAEKMRGRLASVQKDREEFEKQRKELEEAMNIGKQNMGKIKKGLKNNEYEPILVSESVAANTTNGAEGIANMTRKPSQRRESNASTNAVKVGKSSNDLSLTGQKAIQSDSNPIAMMSSPQVSTGNSSSAVIPSGKRVSEWCFTGGIDSSPPIVKNRELYENVRLLGRGSFGEVNLVKNIDDNKLFAIKTIFCAKDTDMHPVLHEVKFLRLNRHPCIIDIHDAFLMTNPRVMHIVMHYCESGSISSYISNAKKNKSSIAESQIVKWTLQLALALQFMHNVNHTLHRDLKPMNIMLTEGSDLIKLADFGLALNMEENTENEVMDEAGTPYYTAPEMIEGKSYSYPADCWSFGIILHQLLTLERPFDGNSTAALVKSVLTEEPPAYPSHYSEEIRAMSYALLIKDPNERLTMNQMLADPFFFHKATSFPSSYRPRVLEERIRRSHVKTLEYQMEGMTKAPTSIVAYVKAYQARRASGSPVLGSAAVSSTTASKSILDPMVDSTDADTHKNPEKVVHHRRYSGHIGVPDVDREPSQRFRPSADDLSPSASSSKKINVNAPLTSRTVSGGDHEDSLKTLLVEDRTMRSKQSSFNNDSLKNESTLSATDLHPNVSFQASQAAKLTHTALQGSHNIHSDSPANVESSTISEGMANSSNTPSPQMMPGFGTDTPVSEVIEQMESFLEVEGMSGKMLRLGHSNVSSSSIMTDDNSPNTPQANQWTAASPPRNADFLGQASERSSIDLSSRTFQHQFSSTYSMSSIVTGTTEQYNDNSEMNTSLNSTDDVDLLDSVKEGSGDHTPAFSKANSVRLNNSMSAILEEVTEDLKTLTTDANDNFMSPSSSKTSLSHSPVPNSHGGRKGQELARAIETDTKLNEDVLVN